MELKPEQLLSRTQAGKLWPVYLIAGPEWVHVIESADAVRARAREQGFLDRHVFHTDSRDFKWHDVVQTAQTQGLFSQRRLLEIRLATGQPGKLGAETLMQLCQSPQPDLICLIIGDQWSKAHQGKWVDAVSRAGVVSIAWPVKPHELPEWVNSRLRLKGILADAQARACLCERVEGNLLAARQEIDKLALLAQGQSLDAKTMKSLVADMARYDVFRLIEQVFSGDPVATIRIMTHFRHEGLHIATLMPMMIKELIRMAALAKEQAKGRSMDATFKSLGVWPSRQAPFRKALARHRQLFKWEHWLVQMAKIDRMMKGRSVGDPWQALERVLVAIAHANPPAAWLR